MNTVKFFRMKNKLTKLELCEITGIQFSRLTRIEQSENLNKLYVGEMINLCNLFQISFDEFINWKG